MSWFIEYPYEPLSDRLMTPYALRAAYLLNDVSQARYTFRGGYGDLEIRPTQPGCDLIAAHMDKQGMSETDLSLTATLSAARAGRPIPAATPAPALPSIPSSFAGKMAPAWVLVCACGQYNLVLDERGIKQTKADATIKGRAEGWGQRKGAWSCPACLSRDHGNGRRG